MRAPVTVIIPTLNSGQELPACLMSLSEGLGVGLIRELIVTDGGSTDDTIAIAEAAGAVVTQGLASRGAQLQRGSAKANGDWLLFLHADTQLDAGWSTPVRSHLATQHAACFRLVFRSSHPLARWTAGWANFRTRLFALPYGDQGLLIPRMLYDDIGGYPSQPLMEDVAIVRKLPRRPVILDATATTSAARYERDGWLFRGAHNLLTLARYLAGRSPERLARDYNSNQIH